MPSSIDSEFAFEIHLALLVGVPLVAALVVAIIAQATYKYRSEGYPYAGVFLVLVGSVGSGLLAFKTAILAGVGYSDAAAFAGLVGLLTLGAFFWVLYAFSSTNPPIRLLKD
ncbi:hypothetical protein A2886_02070 [candidate division WWE3 bacterium RIFCSPHIGHO2_01_FULL_42_13]|uniref:Uncharacterized protein n=1 Tax=candidate division WWE3 bacterium RIFCSPHIGHO2_01_FULL_42_13 TaxID=1802617 RepID=A0A1F4URH5_UNCKA|nr:MAG: hypothetical protein A2886_02070 [candidate division WWE3 bacterium RIFCSPHIGHO2_01_FULL_42_13]